MAITNGTQEGRTLFVFDFDWTIVDQDTDRYPFEIYRTDLRRNLEDEKDRVWTDVVAENYEKLHKGGVTREQIEEAHRNIPFHPAMVRALRSLKSLPNNPAVIIVSNSNTVFIDTILRHYNLLDAFDQVITNPAEWDSEGCLRVRRRVDPDGPQHGCNICAANMCKYQEVEAFIQRNGGSSAFSRVIYSGDGANDYCPVSQLGPTDHALVRTRMGLADRIAAKPVKCGITYWTLGWEAEIALAEQGNKKQ